MVVADSIDGFQNAIADAVSSNGGHVSIYVPDGATVVGQLSIPEGATVNISSDSSTPTLLGRRLAGQQPHLSGSANAIIFDGGGSSRIFDVKGRLRLSGVTIRNGRAQYGGCILISANAVLELNDATISDCTASAGGDIIGDAYGGGVYSSIGSSMTLTDVTVKRCAATHSNVGKAHGGAMYVI